MTLEELSKNSGIKKYKIAEFLGITRQQFHNILTGKNNLSSEKIKILSEKFNVAPMEILKAWEEGKNVGKRTKISKNN